MSNIDKQALTDEAISKAFAGTNFGRDDFKNILAQTIIDAAAGWRCGYTATTICTQLGLLTPKGCASALGLRFISEHVQRETKRLKDELEAAEKISAARLGAIDTTHKMFQRERDRADAAEKRSAELSQKADIYDMLRQDYELQGSLVDFVDWQAKRIAEQRETLIAARSHVMQCARMGDAHANGVLQAIDRAAAVKGGAS